jgi:hypothetical protein
MQEMVATTQNGGPHLLVLYWRAGEIHGSGWLRWLLKQGGVILAPGGNFLDLGHCLVKKDIE